MSLYVIDTTLNPPQEKRFINYSDLVLYLDGMSQRAFGQTRKQRTILLEECGHGADDRNSTLFVRSMQEQFQIGIVRDGRLVRCDVTALISFQKPEFGD
ncbi:MAG TPA: hypothetical protein PKX15_09155 [Bacteroidales bacterium]|nr:hypothetical protein [Bacteroidales bacterium]